MRWVAARRAAPFFDRLALPLIAVGRSVLRRCLSPT